MTTSPRFTQLLPSIAPPPAVRWLAGLGLLTTGSWVRYLATGSLRVDENFPSELTGSLIYALLLLGLLLAVWGWVNLLAQPPERPRRLIYASLAMVAPMLPMLSNDLYTYLTYSGLAARGHDVFSSADAYHLSYWFDWIGERWRTNPCPYAPLALVFAVGPSLAGENHPFLAVFLLRLAWLIPFVAVVELSLRLFRDRPFFHTMLWLNPVILLEGMGQLHLDLLGALAITAGILGQSTGSRVWGAFGWASSILIKWNEAITGAWFWLAGARTWGQRAKSLALMLLVLAALGAAVYLPVWRGPDTLLTPARALASKTLAPGGSVVDVVGEIGSMLRTGLIYDPSTPMLERVAQTQATRAATWQVAQRVMSLLALIALLPLLRLLFLRPHDESLVAPASGILVMIVLTLASPKFQSWYLMSALPFFALSCPPAWKRWWPWVIFASIAQELPLALPREAALFVPSVGFGTGLSAIVFLWSFRARYYGWLDPTSRSEDSPVPAE